MFDKKALITIDKTKCGVADSTDFSALIKGIYDGTGGEPDLRHTDHGGKVTSVNGYDIVFYSDSSLTTKLDHELQYYNHETGEIIVWVRIPTLSVSVNTVIYMGYGDSGITTSQENITGVWRSEFKGVWHLQETSGNHLDSTSNNNDSSVVTVTTQGSATSKIGGADKIMKDNQLIQVGTNNIPIGTTARSVSAWVAIETGKLGGGLFTEYPSNYPTSGYMEFIVGVPNLAAGDELIAWPCDTGDLPAADDTYYHMVWTIAADKTTSLYKNAVLKHQGAFNYTGISSLTKCEIGKRFGNTSIDGYVDEIKIYEGVLTPSWITAEFNNGNSPETFYTMGPEVSAKIYIPQIIIIPRIV